MRAKSPLISVIMPAYNVDKYIGQAISSILNQTHKNLELIIIDDGSTDKTGAIAKAYAKRDSRVRVFLNEKNSKQWFCRNMGLEKARGDYIAWMDSDDVCMPERLEQQLQYLNNYPEVGMVGTYIKFIDNNNQEITGEHYNEWFKKILTHPCVNDHGLYVVTIPASYFFRKSILSELAKPYFRSIALGEDMDFQFRLMEKNIKIYNMPNILYHYRRHDSQLTSRQFDLLVSLVLIRYLAISRRVFGFDPLDVLLKKYNKINGRDVIAMLIKILIKSIPHREQKKFRTLTLRTLQYLFYALLIRCYTALPFAHKPWRVFKKILQRLVSIRPTTLFAITDKPR